MRREGRELFLYWWEVSPGLLHGDKMIPKEAAFLLGNKQHCEYPALSFCTELVDHRHTDRWHGVELLQWSCLQAAGFPQEGSLRRGGASSRPWAHGPGAVRGTGLVCALSQLVLGGGCSQGRLRGVKSAQVAWHPIASTYKTPGSGPWRFRAVRKPRVTCLFACEC